jgi:hypothetical protein
MSQRDIRAAMRFNKPVEDALDSIEETLEQLEPKRQEHAWNSTFGVASSTPSSLPSSNTTYSSSGS